MGRRPRRDLVPNANSPQLLTRLLEAVAQGVRSNRGLQEFLGVDTRTVNYYSQAAEWLGLVETAGEVCLTSLGLEYVYAGKRRPEIYARTVLAQPFVARIMSESGRGLPDVDAIAEAISEDEPEMSKATVARRAGAVRALIAPAMGTRVRKPAPRTHQLALPLGLHPETSAPPRLEQSTSHEYNPDVYRFLLAALVDHGELTMGHVRALLDRAEADSAPIGGYIDLALTRGDAFRKGERLVVTGEALKRGEVIDTTTSIVLSDPGYREYLAALVSATQDGQARARLDKIRGRYRAWDLRLFGRAASASSLDDDLSELLLDRTLSSFPLCGGPADEIEPIQGPFLSNWEQEGLAVAAPPHLAQLLGGVAAVNRFLKVARTASVDVRPPQPAYRPVVFHGGLLHPGEALPRSVPDTRSLRERLLSNAPWPAMTAAALLLHRHRSSRFRVARTHGRWEIRRDRDNLGGLMSVLDAFARSRGWLSSRRRSGGLSANRLLDVLEAVGIAIPVGDNMVLAETFFSHLRGEAEELELYERLLPLSEALGQFLDERRLPGK